MPDGRVWIDFDNTPHVLFLEPIIRRLWKRGYECRVTARRHGQTEELAAARGIHADLIGVGDRVGKAAKVLGVLGRSAALTTWARGQRFRLLVSSSRSASLAARVAGVAAVGLLDYEHAEQLALAASCQVIWLPDILTPALLPVWTRRVAQFYPGLKENLYLDSWPVDREATRTMLGIDAATYLVVSRPPADTAYYASDKSTKIWLDAVRSLARGSEVQVVVAARGRTQSAVLQDCLGAVERVSFLEHVMDGPQLVGAADLVLGGGGTMNREAAVLGVPVWSVFCGRPPRIDEQLAAEGRLRWVRAEDELRDALRRELPGRQPPRGPVPEGIEAVMTDIESRLQG